MKCLPLILLVLIVLTKLQAQSKRVNYWYFGYESGLDFSSGQPVSDSKSKSISIEGSCTMADTMGNLLFYSNGEKVWDKNHVVMPNGNNILGNESASQSCIAMPVPGDDTKYYLFTTDIVTLRYSIIDMSLNNGSGNVASGKNIMLNGHATEALAGTMHCNGTDYWIIIRNSQYNVLKFTAYLVTSTGISKPVVSEFKHNNSNTINDPVGCITFSQDGKKLCYSSLGGHIYLFDFSTTTGHLTYNNKIYLNHDEFAYSNAFSPDGKKLYASIWEWKQICSVVQFNLEATNIASQRITLDTESFKYGSPNGYGYIGHLRLAPDQRIYISRWHQYKPYQVNPETFFSLDSIDVIHFPDSLGKGCKFQRNFLHLKGKPTMIGLPNFISNFTAIKPAIKECVKITAAFTYKQVCGKYEVEFQMQGNEISKALWIYTDSVSGSSDSSFLHNPKHNFGKPGKYWVTLVVAIGDQRDTLTKEIIVMGKPHVNLGGDKILCPGKSITLAAQPGNFKYLWSTGDTSINLQVHKTGQYWVTVSIGDCRVTAYVNILPLPVKNLLGNDTVICLSKPFWVRPTIQLTEKEWSTGNINGDSVEITQSAKIWLRATIGDCEISDTINITVLPQPNVNLGANDTLCEGAEKILDAGLASNYLWSNGERTQTINVNKAGKYSVHAFSADCTAADTIELSACPAVFHIPNSFTPNTDSLNDNFRIYGSDIANGNLKIFNRWGECVYDSEDFYVGWDGKFHGEDCPVDAYFYIFFYKEYMHNENDGYQKSKQGIVNLTR